MKGITLKLITALLLIAVLCAPVLTGCTNGEDTPEPPTEPALEPTETPYEWPTHMHLAAVGTSGLTKTTSWISVMEGSTGAIIRIQPESSYVNVFPMMKANDFVFCALDRVNLKNNIEAIDDHAQRDGGAWMAGLVWAESYASSGFMVRGDSNIYTPHDIKPGMKLATHKMETASLNPLRSLLAWAGVSEDDITWVDTGTREANARAVAEGRADICFMPPISPSVFEAAAAPNGIRYIDMNPNEDPEGYAAYMAVSPMYVFGPAETGPEGSIGKWMPSSYKFVTANFETDEELIYNTCKWLDENYDAYQDKYDSNVFMTLEDTLLGLATSYTPLHPGLVKYLDEKGLWTDAHEERQKFNIAWIQEYIDAYADAIAKADAAGIEVKPSNEAWIELWENYKKDNEIPVIAMHTSLTENAEMRPPAGYVPPEPVEEGPAAGATGDIAVEIVELKNAHPDQDVELTVKTEPGAEVTVVFTMPNGDDSAYPADRTKVAGDDGIVYWKWNINSHIPTGEAIFTITVTKDGKEGILIHKVKI
jgi:NMT1 family protein